MYTLVYELRVRAAEQLDCERPQWLVAAQRSAHAAAYERERGDLLLSAIPRG
jgi:hypothetical protein